MATTEKGRVRVILGETGNNWLLLESGRSEDDDSVWHKRSWNDIPGPVAKQLNNCTAKGRHATEVAFGPTGAWYVHGIKADGSGAYYWWGKTSACGTSIAQYEKFAFGTNADNGQESWFFLKGDNDFECHNCPSSLVERANRTRQRGKSIYFVRLFHENLYFIYDEDGCQTSELGFGKPTSPIEDVSVAADGSVVIVHVDHFRSSAGVSESLVNALREHFGTNEQTDSPSKQTSLENDHTVSDLDPEGNWQQQMLDHIDKLQERADKAAALESELSELRDVTECRLVEESQHIRELERHISVRKRSIAETIDKMPPDHRASLRRRLLPDASEGACVICRGAQVVIAIVPCGHLCLCQGCAAELTSREEACPLCRGVITGTLKIFGAVGLQN